MQEGKNTADTLSTHDVQESISLSFMGECEFHSFKTNNKNSLI